MDLSTSHAVLTTRYGILSTVLRAPRVSWLFTTTRTRYNRIVYSIPLLLLISPSLVWNTLRREARDGFRVLVGKSQSLKMCRERGQWTWGECSQHRSQRGGYESSEYRAHTLARGPCRD
ncbi:uncharacterized protein SCHCODRAFT_02241430 [Schizophyllum commune H4-8]|uniref:uncharacterized protein n=1 Tax=Schizophyllum commune (strain H4-8 / FGSC 9210) TaxID=578458 RepID=UPI00215EDE3B|nr:uncharacterized protein SCHCODRAFT_02241430 [Schizophyllum commune H4-8]KAI5895859.1 hypothetical protein SCHCODRAFT_02241430 [Schizophyllum commune H4-8]